MLALDYGSARTGVALSDPTGTLAKPLRVIERVSPKTRIEMIAAIVEEARADVVVVGLPLTLRGEEGEQARETQEFVEALRGRLSVPVETYDERFTTSIAATAPSRKGSEDARAAAHLLESYLAWTSREE
ncbi:MAG: Holliday junction resolvase RuvX [Gaiellaceae bacterium]